MSEWLDKVEQDLKYAYENGDRTAQTRLFVHHVPQMINKLRALEPVEVEDEAEWEEASDALEAEADLEKADPVVGEADEAPSDLPEDQAELESMVDAEEIG